MKILSRISTPQMVVVGILSMAVVVFSGLSFSAKGSPPTVGNRAQVDAAPPAATERQKHRQFKIELQQISDAFPGKVDIFFDLVELQTRKPALPNVRFSIPVRVLGVTYFWVKNDAGETWLVKPESIFAVRVNPK